MYGEAVGRIHLSAKYTGWHGAQIGTRSDVLIRVCASRRVSRAGEVTRNRTPLRHPAVRGHLRGVHGRARISAAGEGEIERLDREWDDLDLMAGAVLVMEHH